MSTHKATIRRLPVLNAQGKREDVVLRIDSNKNEYMKVDNYWIRNFSKTNVVPKDINNLYDDSDIKVIIENEIKNEKLTAPNLLEENIYFDDVLIISDGLGFNDHKNLLQDIRSNVCVIALNKTMVFWEAIKFPDFYLISSPFENCLADIPKKGYPKLIASRRTCHKFISAYRNVIYFYDPTCDDKYKSPVAKNSSIYIDEYRNPICAALNCAFNFRAKNIYLAYCSDGYKAHRPGCISVDENSFCYPQQQLANNIVNANIFWNKFSNPNNNIYYTGIKNSFSFAKYVESDDFRKLIS